MSSSRTESQTGTADNGAAIPKPDTFERIRSDVISSGQEARVDVNQRHLIDKILSRYATPFSVYRELLQNSDDAGATCAEVQFCTSISSDLPSAETRALRGSKEEPGKRIIREVVYRNNGAFFNQDDWSRLTCIASGNPNPDHIGFFGVGSFTLFSLCDEPLVVSGSRALVFHWKGDALYTKFADCEESNEWTSFILKARDSNLVPNLQSFGSFLASSLTFTSSLVSAKVFVDGSLALSITKDVSSVPSVMSLPRANSWWNRNAVVLSSPSQLFTLETPDESLTDTQVRVSVRTSSNGENDICVVARLISADVLASVSAGVSNRMRRVTKKYPPKRFKIRLLLPCASSEPSNLTSSARSDDTIFGNAGESTIFNTFIPRIGGGKVYIGFQTSQTTGVACHLAGPFIPTVEREAIDLVDNILRRWNSELLFLCGVVMRLALEHGMNVIANKWEADSSRQCKMETDRSMRITQRIESHVVPRTQTSLEAGDSLLDQSMPMPVSALKRERRGLLAGFASFMGQAANEVRRFATIVTGATNSDDFSLLQSDDDGALSSIEKDAIVLMRCFEPKPSTPDTQVGAYIASGFETCLPGLSAPVLSRVGVVRGERAYLPHLGIDNFALKSPVVRPIVQSNVENYIRHVANVSPITVPVLAMDLKDRVVAEDELLLLIYWFSQYAKKCPQDAPSFPALKDNLSVRFNHFSDSSCVHLRNYVHYSTNSVPPDMPLPASTLPRQFSSRIPLHVLETGILSTWVSPLPWHIWAAHIADHHSFLSPSVSNDLRLHVLDAFAQEWSRKCSQSEKDDCQRFLRRIVERKPCVPADGGGLKCPQQLYIHSPELEVFSSPQITKVCSSVLQLPNISNPFLIALGLREAVSLEILFQELERLKWTQDPSGLIRYLMLVSNKLSDAEWRRLRAAKILPCNLDQELHEPSEIYLPSPELENLGFIPILRWNSRLETNSTQARFLSDRLGVRLVPPLEVIIRAASETTTSSDVREKCIDFAASNVAQGLGNYKFEVTSSARIKTLKFLPAIKLNLVDKEKPEMSVLCSINECFTDKSARVLGLPTVLPRFQRQAELLQVASTPVGHQCVSALVGLCEQLKNSRCLRPNFIAENMALVFEYLSQHVGMLNDSDRAKLREYPFVPLRSRDNDDIVLWRKPSEVFFHRDGKMGDVATLFDVVDESLLLRSVGVRDEPSITEICNIIIEDPHMVYRKYGGSEGYQVLLQLIGSHVSVLPRTTLKKLKCCSFLLATRFQSDDCRQVNEENDQAETRQVNYALAVASDIVIVDDSFLQQMFNPLCAPLDAGLENLYSSLGSAYITHAVSRRYEICRKPGLNADVSSMSREVRMKILQRRGLILQSTSRQLLPDAHMVLSNQLEVLAADLIRGVYTLQGESKLHTLTCCIEQRHAETVTNVRSSARSRFILFVTTNVDYFDVASAIGTQLYARCSLQDTFLLAQLLETSLSQLRSRGFPVDKIASTPQTQLLSVEEHGVESMRQTQLEQKDTKDETVGARLSGYQAIVGHMFPDADMAWVHQKLASDPSEATLRSLKAEMESRCYPRIPNSTPPVSAYNGNSRTFEGSGSPGTSSAGSRNRAPEASFERGVPGASFSRALKALKGLGGSRLSSGPLSSRRSRQYSSVADSQTTSLNEAHSVIANDSCGDIKDVENMRKTDYLLSQGIKAARPVGNRGISNPAMILPVVDADTLSSSCEVIPGHDLKPILTLNNGNRKTVHGFGVFATRADDMYVSQSFVMQNWDSVEQFGSILAVLVRVFALDARAIAIYYTPNGQSVAFNSNGSLFFNLRFYMAVRDEQNDHRLHSFAYWYTTLCHELAHNLTSRHDQVHGFYSESYIEHFLPRFILAMKELTLV